jgi:hypothetical protein
MVLRPHPVQPVQTAGIVWRDAGQGGRGCAATRQQRSAGQRVRSATGPAEGHEPSQAQMVQDRGGVRRCGRDGPARLNRRAGVPRAGVADQLPAPAGHRSSHVRYLGSLGRGAPVPDQWEGIGGPLRRTSRSLPSLVRTVSQPAMLRPHIANTEEPQVDTRSPVFEARHVRGWIVLAGQGAAASPHARRSRANPPAGASCAGLVAALDHTPSSPLTGSGAGLGGVRGASACAGRSGAAG